MITLKDDPCKGKKDDGYVVSIGKIEKNLQETVYEVMDLINWKI